MCVGVSRRRGDGYLAMIWEWHQGGGRGEDVNECKCESRAVRRISNGISIVSGPGERYGSTVTGRAQKDVKLQSRAGGMGIGGSKEEGMESRRRGRYHPNGPMHI